MASYGCGNHCGVDMIYVGNGNWKCPSCGRGIAFDEPNEGDDDENLSVYDAAQIWLSNGKDEDYMFGYSEDELEDAL